MHGIWYTSERCSWIVPSQSPDVSCMSYIVQNCRLTIYFFRHLLQHQLTSSSSQALYEVSTPIVRASINDTLPNDYCAAGILQDNYHI